MEKKSKSSKTRWHRLLGALLEELLVPVGISVFVDFPVMSEPPQSDILLLRKQGHTWSDQQKARLPDGIRDSRASNILIEFKYAESVNEHAFRQILSYDHFYRSAQRLKKEEAESFLISARTPQKETLNQFGYAETDQPGVYRSRDSLLKSIGLLSLNELSHTDHNLWFKFFATRKEEKQSAFDLLIRKGLYLLTIKLEWITDGLLQVLLEKGENTMENEITPEVLMEMGKRWKSAILSHLRPEEIDQILSTLKPEKRLSGLRPEEVLARYKPEERLQGLSPEDIEEYLQKIRTRKKKQKRSR